MATLIEIRNKANAKLAEMWPIIQAKEDAYFISHGRYFGLNWSPVLEIKDGIDTNFIIDHPLTEHILSDVVFPATTIPYQIKIFRCSQYDNEFYWMFVRIQLLNGNIWERNRTKDGTDSGWYQVITPQ